MYKKELLIYLMTILRFYLKLEQQKKLFQRLPIVLAKIKKGKKSEDLLNKNCQIMFSLYQSRKMTKRVII